MSTIDEKATSPAPALPPEVRADVAEALGVFFENPDDAKHAEERVLGAVARHWPRPALDVDSVLAEYVSDPKDDGTYTLSLNAEETTELRADLLRLVARPAPVPADVREAIDRIVHQYEDEPALDCVEALSKELARHWLRPAAVTADGVAMIAEERARQVAQERWTPEHDDDEHTHGELALAAAVYAIPERQREWKNWHLGFPKLWPWSLDYYKPTPDDRIRELVKAGALIAAEIDRLRRKGGAR